MTFDNVRKTVADLLRLAENDAATQGEVDNAIKFARRLMEAHHLTEEDCRATDPNAPRTITFGTTEVYGYNVRMIWWEKQLAAFVQDFIGSIKVLYSRQQKAIRNDAGIFQAWKVATTFYGPIEEVQLAKELYYSMYNVITAMAKLRYGVIVRGAGRSYAEGFVDGLFHAFWESKRQDKLSSPQTNALIVRSEGLMLAKQDAVMAWIEKDLKVKISKRGIRTTRAHTVDYDCFQEGSKDGRKANVSANRKAKLEGSQQRHLS